MTTDIERDEIELFLQGEGITDIVLARVPRGGTTRDIIEAARQHGLTVPMGADVLVFVEDAEEPLDSNTSLQSAGIAHRGRVHVHRCRRVAITVNFNADHKTADFSPSATVGHVKRWAVGHNAFNLHGVDATEHVLQLCNSMMRPDEDVHIGTLVSVPACGLCFDLVAKQRVEG